MIITNKERALDTIHDQINLIISLTRAIEQCIESIVLCKGNTMDILEKSNESIHRTVTALEHTDIMRIVVLLFDSTISSYRKDSGNNAVDTLILIKKYLDDHKQVLCELSDCLEKKNI